MLDIDHFKNINDSHGHLTGDRALQRVAETLRQGLREVDTLGRLGGEEFAALLPEVSLDQALDVAERLRAGVEALRVSNPDGEPLRMTVSIRRRPAQGRRGRPGKPAGARRQRALPGKASGATAPSTRPPDMRASAEHCDHLPADRQQPAVGAPTSAPPRGRSRRASSIPARVTAPVAAALLWQRLEELGGPGQRAGHRRGAQVRQQPAARSRAAPASGKLHGLSARLRGTHPAVPIWRDLFEENGRPPTCPAHGDVKASELRVTLRYRAARLSSGLHPGRWQRFHRHRRRSGRR